MRHHWSSLWLTVLLVKLMKQQCINLKISCVSFGDFSACLFCICVISGPPMELIDEPLFFPSSKSTCLSIGFSV